MFVFTGQRTRRVQTERREQLIYSFLSRID
jgi:hypothetical protein